MAICLETGEMKVNDIADKIERWTVWFGTPTGVCSTLEEARETCKKLDYPYHLIRPIPVALGSKLYELVVW